jgi:hypothetical protein
MMSRRTFTNALGVGAAASVISSGGMAAASNPAKARNVVLVHGLFADGSCWSEVIARLQVQGFNPSWSGTGRTGDRAAAARCRRCQ